MEVKACLTTRRSVRQFTDRPVTREQLEELVTLASYAPSWKNSQTVRYTAVTDTDLKRRLAEDCTMGFSHNREIMESAAAVIVLRTVKGRSGYERDGSPTTSKGEHWQSFDAGIAAATFCLAAHELGLGTVIMGIYDEERVAALLSIPPEEGVSALIALGEPAQIPDPPKKKGVSELLQLQ